MAYWPRKPKLSMSSKSISSGPLHWSLYVFTCKILCKQSDAKNLEYSCWASSSTSPQGTTWCHFWKRLRHLIKFFGILLWFCFLFFDYLLSFWNFGLEAQLYDHLDQPKMEQTPSAPISQLLSWEARTKGLGLAARHSSKEKHGEKKSRSSQV